MLCLSQKNDIYLFLGETQSILITTQPTSNVSHIPSIVSTEPDRVVQSE
jgi:hypothetical protein